SSSRSPFTSLARICSDVTAPEWMSPRIIAPAMLPPPMKPIFLPSMRAACLLMGATLPRRRGKMWPQRNDTRARSSRNFRGQGRVGGPVPGGVTMLEAFRLGGWGMFPTLIFGVLMIAATVRYAVRPERRFVPLQVTLGLLTLAAGCLGFVTGMIKTFLAMDSA